MDFSLNQKPKKKRRKKSLRQNTLRKKQGDNKNDIEKFEKFPKELDQTSEKIPKNMRGTFFFLFGVRSFTLSFKEALLNVIRNFSFLTEGSS